MRRKNAEWIARRKQKIVRGEAAVVVPQPLKARKSNAST